MICPSCRAQNDDSAETCFKCGKGLYALTEGSLVSGRYEILRPLGHGGMGMVYKAKDAELEEIVAIKVLRPDIAGSPDIARRFRSEIKLARRVSHRNVCRIHEYGRDGHLAYIVMEFVEGVDLKRLIRERGAFPAQDAFEIAIQVAKALQAIHEVGIVHRDLKTPNIMRDEQGVVKLMDFGIAKSFDAAATGVTGVTATGLIVGTPEYMSPEQARGNKVDARSDVYSLGIVAYELFTGDVPFRGDTPIATLLKHLQEPPPLDPSAVPRLPRPLVPVLAKALAKSREERFASARDMSEALKRARIEAFPSTAPTPVPVLSATVPAHEPAADTTPMPTPVPTPFPRLAETPAAPAPAVRPARPAPPARRASPATAQARHAPVASSLGLWLAALGIAAVGVAGALLVFGRPDEPAGGAPATTPMAADSRVDRPPASEASLAPEAPAASAPAPPAAAGVTENLLSTPPRQGSGGGPMTAPSRPAVAPAAPPTPLSTLPLRRVPPAEAQAGAGSAARTEAEPRPAEPDAPAQPAAAEGFLQLGVRPYADVSIDGGYVGTTPMRPVKLGAGPHTVRLEHPDYEPFVRKVTIRAGETTRLNVDLALDAIPK